MHALRRPVATSLLVGALLILPFTSYADEDLAAKRGLCQTEARERIKPPHAGSVDLFQITMESRQAYVRECMARAPSPPVSTGLVNEPKKPVPSPSGHVAPRRR